MVEIFVSCERITPPQKGKLVVETLAPVKMDLKETLLKCRVSGSLPDGFRVKAIGIVYGAGVNSLSISSYSYDYPNSIGVYNYLYGCFQTHSFRTVSKDSEVVHFSVRVYIQETGEEYYGMNRETVTFLPDGSVTLGEYVYRLYDLDKGKRYYYRAFAIVENDSSTNEKSYSKILYGETLFFDAEED